MNSRGNRPLQYLRQLDRSISDGINDAFARVFGGALAPAEIQALLEREASDAVEELDDGTLVAPNHFIIRVNPTDYHNLTSANENIAQHFTNRLAGFMRDQGWKNYGGVFVEFAPEDRLHTGQMRAVGAVYVDDDIHPMNISGEFVSDAELGNREAESYRPAAAVAAELSGAPADRYAGMYQGDKRYEHSYRRAYEGPRNASTGAMAAQPARVRLDVHDGSARTLTLTEGTALIGRGHEAALRINDPGCSRSHAKVAFNGVQAVITDLRSTNGTFVNGHRIDSWQLADGDRVRMGQTEVTVHFT